MEQKELLPRITRILTDGAKGAFDVDYPEVINMGNTQMPSFPRRRESSAFAVHGRKTLGPRLRGDDELSISKLSEVTKLNWVPLIPDLCVAQFDTNQRGQSATLMRINEE